MTLPPVSPGVPSPPGEHTRNFWSAEHELSLFCRRRRIVGRRSLRNPWRVRHLHLQAGGRGQFHRSRHRSHRHIHHGGAVRGGRAAGTCRASRHCGRRACGHPRRPCHDHMVCQCQRLDQGRRHSSTSGRHHCRGPAPYRRAAPALFPRSHFRLGLPAGGCGSDLGCGADACAFRRLYHSHRAIPCAHAHRPAIARTVAKAHGGGTDRHSRASSGAWRLGRHRRGHSLRADGDRATAFAGFRVTQPSRRPGPCCGTDRRLLKLSRSTCWRRADRHSGRRRQHHRYRQPISQHRAFLRHSCRPSVVATGSPLG
ncbi:Hypothetical protein BSUIS_B1404 [Brucella suis ATCC 23445]|uniref:Uncharacterized protein n=1 Tax=Brucella suis (strain ATCC 23445 / NCTC 10510) TaxID=470137 RepID=A9WXA7_BRUSI|nr:Hypothetical protein BSUIS_B1404 [Brucella suis ATCC 23445]